MRTDKELKQIAIDIHAGRIWTDRHCQNPDDITRVFMPLIFALADVEKTEDKVEQLKRKVEKSKNRKLLEEAGMIFEYIDKAGPMAINGMPMFLSFHILNKEETVKVCKYYEKVCKAIDKI
jgi:hypothetical protein